MDAAAAIFEASLDPIIVIDSSGMVRGWNPAAESVLGYPREEALGRELAELIVPGPLRDAHRAGLARHLETGETTIIGRHVEVVARHRDGHELAVELSVIELSTGEFAGFLRPVDRDARRRDTARLQKRLGFLSQAGLVLDRSLELEETLRRLAELTVPELAQLTVIDVVTDSGEITAAAAAGREPAHARALEEMRRAHPLPTDGPHPVAAALRSRRAQLLGAMTADFQRDIAEGDEHFALMRRLRYHSAIVVPLIARQRVLGVLSLLRMDDAPSYDADDLVLAEDLGRRAALAIDNARLYESTRHVARTLQESLLPAALPEIDGVRMAARYRAAAQGQEVGGDFYDAFSLDGERWGIAVGDVRGKGPRAAALTALARYTIRALCDRGAGPVLSLLNDAVLREGETLPERFLTAVVGVAERRGAGLGLELASAGHPPPLILRADGRVEATRAGGLLIGVDTDISYQTEQVTLNRGETLVLYTDGLTDARAPAHVVTEAQLASLVARGRGLDAGQLAELLLASAAGEGEPRDDIAILVVQVMP